MKLNTNNSKSEMKNREFEQKIARLEAELQYYQSMAGNLRQWRPDQWSKSQEDRIREKFQENKQSFINSRFEELLKQEIEKYQKLVAENRRLEERIKALESKSPIQSLRYRNFYKIHLKFNAGTGVWVFGILKSDSYSIQPNRA